MEIPPPHHETPIIMLPALVESHTGGTAYSTTPVMRSHHTQKEAQQPQNNHEETSLWTKQERRCGQAMRFTFLAAGIILVVLGCTLGMFVCGFVGIVLLVAAVYTIVVPFVSDLWIDPQQQNGRVWRVLMSTIGVCVYIAQAILLDFFIHKFQHFDWAWIVFDVLVFVAVLVLAHGITGLRLLGTSTFFSMRQYLAGFCVATYTALLLGKMCVIALNSPLDANGFWSRTTFIVVLGSCIPIHILLRWTLDRPNATGGGMFSEGPNPWQLCLEHIFLVINLVDVFAVLEFLPPAGQSMDDQRKGFSVLSIVIACLSHVTAVTIYYSPVVLYAQLHAQSAMSRGLTFFIRHGQFILVDGFLLSLRLVAWLWMNGLPTAFIVKNVSFVLLGVSYEKAFRLGSASICEKNLRAAEYHIAQLNDEVERLRIDAYTTTANVTHNTYVHRSVDFLQQSVSQVVDMPTHHAYHMTATNEAMMGVNVHSAAYVQDVHYVDGFGPTNDDHHAAVAVPGTPLLVRASLNFNSPKVHNAYPHAHHTTPNSPKSP